MIAVYIALGILSLLLLLFLFALFPTLRRHPDRTVLKGARIAHRGLHDLAKDTPENSLAAFKAAIEAGYPIETDLHLTADGQVAVFHDDTLARMCGVEGEPEKMTLAELKELRLAEGSQQIPTLAELLELVEGKVPLLIEFKCKNAAGATPLCEAADRLLAEYTGRYLIQSFNPLAVRWYKKNRPDVCRGQLASAFYRDPPVQKLIGCLLFNCLTRPDFISYEHLHANHICRRLCRRLGGFPVGWTFHSQQEIDAHTKDFETFIFEGFIPE